MKRVTLLILFLLTVSCTISSTKTPPTSTLSSVLPTVTMTTLPTVASTSTIEIPITSPLPQAEADAMILDLLQYNNDCLFPCWFGLVPGKTTAQATKALLEKFTASSLRTNFFDEMGGAHWRINKNDLFLDTLVGFTYNQLLSGVLESLNVTIEVKGKSDGGSFETTWENPLNEQYLQAYKLPQVLLAYGQPENVFIFANEGWKYFELVLDYSDQGFAIWYSAPLESSGDKYLGCMSKAFTNLYLWTPEFTYTWAEGVTGSNDKSEIDSLNRDFQPLEDAASMTLNEFYDTFANVDNVNCLETPKEIWPGP